MTVQTTGRLERLARYRDEFQKYSKVSNFSSIEWNVHLMHFQLVTRVEGKSFDFPKHHLKSHPIDDIYQAGAIPNFSTRVGEGIHQEIRQSYALTNCKEAEGQVCAEFLPGDQLLNHVLDNQGRCEPGGHCPHHQAGSSVRRCRGRGHKTPRRGSRCCTARCRCRSKRR
jgi:hypothetical protein